MATTLLGLLTAVLGALGHAAAARWLPGRWLLRSILGADAFAFIVLLMVWMANGYSPSVIELVTAAAIAFSLAVAHILFFIGIIYDSPTLALAHAILDEEPAGMRVEALGGLVTRYPFMKSRLDALLASGVLAVEGEALVFRHSIGTLVRLSDAYHRLCGRDIRTG